MENDLSIVQLIYCSRAKNLGNNPGFERDVRDILDHSRTCNPLHDITGALMTDGEMFAQVVEGPAAAVRTLYSKIIRDKRHENVTTLQRVLTHVRLFNSWPIAFIRVENIPCIEALDVQTAPAALRKASDVVLKAFWPLLLG